MVTIEDHRRAIANLDEEEKKLMLQFVHISERLETIQMLKRKNNNAIMQLEIEQAS